jgi:hypothetical protein
LVKPLVRNLEREQGVLIIDDTIEEKPYTADERELLCWHYDHSKGRNLKGINLLSTLYQLGDASAVAVAFELVKKTEWAFNEKKGRSGKGKAPKPTMISTPPDARGVPEEPDRVPLRAQRGLVRLL